jgi:hypothetical protein
MIDRTAPEAPEGARPAEPAPEEKPAEKEEETST